MIDFHCHLDLYSDPHKVADRVQQEGIGIVEQHAHLIRGADWLLFSLGVGFGGHLAADLMSHYFRSGAANDLAYRRAIGRDACRGLAGSDGRPTPLAAKA